MTTITIRKSFTYTAVPVVFESKLPDLDGCKFFVASTCDFKLNNAADSESQGVLIAFGSDDIKEEGSGHYSDYFAFSADDDKKHIAAQLRELADWFDKQ